MNHPHLRIGLAANRQVGYHALRLLQTQRLDPVALLVADGRASDDWTQRMVESASSDTEIFTGKSFRSTRGVERLRKLDLDYLISVHFPYIVPSEVLEIPKIGTLNLHPAYLPFNRGWHTPSWAIADGTPYGATLHWMDTGIDTGDVSLQRAIDVTEFDTADSLYARVLALEVALFGEAIPLLRQGRLPRIPQQIEGTSHRKQDLRDVQQLRLDAVQTVGETLRQLRSLTTNRWDEAAYFEADNQRYHVQVVILKGASEQVESARKAA